MPNLASGECLVMATWNKEIKFNAGYPEHGESRYMCFGDEKNSAPVVCFKGLEPFEFQIWGDAGLVIGTSTYLSFVVGHHGEGYGAFCTTVDYILDNDDYLVATLKYADKHGVKKEAASKIRKHC